MGASMMRDFAVGSNGHCFFCLSQIRELKPSQELLSPLKTQTISLQYLTRYLKMDLKKVFIDKGQVSPELLEKVEKARLKAELCEECRCLGENFSRVYRQLEKLELELGSTLGLIHGKLTSKEATGKLRGLTSGSNSKWNGLLEVLDVLRTEAIQKSSNKLPDTPRVRIQHLTVTELQATQPLAQNDTETSLSQMAHHGLETSGVKMESTNEDRLTDNENETYFSEVADSNQDGEPMIDYVEIERDLNEDDNIVHKNRTGDKKVASRPTRNIVGTGRCSIDPETGKRGCNDCSKQFNSATAFRLHYQTVHLKLRYKCVSCNKLFSNKANLTTHQRTTVSCAAAGSAPKYKCHLCEKSFVTKKILQTHLDGVHFKILKYECNICEKKFTTNVALSIHRRQLHQAAK